MRVTAPAAPEAAIAVGFEAPAQVDAPYGVYIHIPFCDHICPYCDFNTYAGQSERIPAYVAAVKRDAELWAPRFDRRAATSVFFGGGTPSLLTPSQISDILAACRATFALADDSEITMESNPNDLTVRYCAGVIEAGVNRISIGAQTLDRRGLRVLGRRHESSTIAAAVQAARAAGFANVNLDFISGWPGQTLEQWRSDLNRVLHGEVGGSPPDHLSLYGLIVEPGTPMADAVQRGILTPVDDDAAADFTELATTILDEAGWLRYEIANWASAPEKASRHNAVYWRNGDYAGIGAGAHGHVGGERTMNQPSPQRYIDALRDGRSPITNTETITERTAMGETMMLGLRLLQDGVSGKAFRLRHGIAMEAQFGPSLDRLRDLGVLDIDHERVRLTKRGALLANSVCAEFL